MAEPLTTEPYVPDSVVISAIQDGATPFQVERAVTERRESTLHDPLVLLVRETGVPFYVLDELIERWGIRP